MALPTTTASVLHAVTGTIIGWSVGEEANGTIVITEWNTGDLGTQPTEQQINDWATDAVALPSGQLFSQWLVEHGGDVIATAKRIAKELQDADDETARIIRAVVKLTVDEINTLRQWITAFKAEVAEANNLGTLKTGVAGLPNVPDRTYPQARTAVTNIIGGE